MSDIVWQDQPTDGRAGAGKKPDLTVPNALREKPNTWALVIEKAAASNASYIKKYELTDETRDGLRRIRAVRDIPRWNVRAGDLGGWLESEANLSQFGDAWVFGDAQVSDTAQVSGAAWLSSRSHILSWSGPITPNVHNATLYRTSAGYTLRVGCWKGTATDLHALADSDIWPSGGDAEYRATWAPCLHALADHAAAVAATWKDDK